MKQKRFIIGYHYINLWQWSLGMHIDLQWPHLMLHVPTGFITVGWWHYGTISELRWGPFRFSSSWRVRNSWRFL